MSKESHSSAAAEAAARPASGRARVLVVEDHADTLVLTARLLRAEGYDVTTAGLLADARRVLDDGGADVVVVDVGLPDGHGCDLLPHACGARGVVLSGYDAVQDRCRAATFGEYLVKPVTFERLAAAVRRAVAQKERVSLDGAGTAGGRSAG